MQSRESIDPAAVSPRRPRRIDPEARLRGARKGALVAAERRREDAELWLEDWPLWMVVVERRAEGMSLAQIANEFTRDEYETPQGKTRWYPAQIARILRRINKKADEYLAELHATIDELKKVMAMEHGKQVADEANEEARAEDGDAEDASEDDADGAVAGATGP